MTDVAPVASLPPRVGSEEVATKARSYLNRVLETIVGSERRPFSSTLFASTMASVDAVFRCVEEGFNNIEDDIPPRDKVEKLVANQTYRQEVEEFSDFVIFIVDTFAEAEIEVFDVPGCTKILQEMLCTYIPEFGNWINSFVLILLTQPECRVLRFTK
jgi:hypothetical protein